MATRSDVQVSLDLVRFINIANDLIDAASYKLREVDPDTGLELLKVDQTGAREYTLGELKEDIRKTLQAILNYEGTVNSFIGSYGLSNITKSVAALGLDGENIQAELSAIATEARSILSQLEVTKTKQELIPLGQHIDQTIPKLVLVRRPWGLGS